jgi:hypothetical protein
LFYSLILIYSQKVAAAAATKKLLQHKKNKMVYINKTYTNTRTDNEKGRDDADR